MDDLKGIAWQENAKVNLALKDLSSSECPKAKEGLEGEKSIILTMRVDKRIHFLGN